jgi:hypothetical protein
MLDAVAARDADRLRTLFETSIRTTRDRLIAEMPTGEEGPDPLDRLLDQGA